MANRRCFQTLTRCLQTIRTLAPFPQTVNPASAQCLSQIPASKQRLDVLHTDVNVYTQPAIFSRHFCSKPTGSEEDDDEYDDEDDESEEEEIGESAVVSPENKEQEAAEIGYQVVGPLRKSDRVDKPCEPVFAVVQIGSHQFKVCNGDAIYTERLKYCDINDWLILNKVLMLGSKTQTIIGRPILPDAAVHAIVEEHALDAKVIIFKKKRRKNYRRTKGHRQELTKLRIINIEGIEKGRVLKAQKNDKTEKATVSKTLKEDKPEKVAVEA